VRLVQGDGDAGQAAGAFAQRPFSTRSARRSATTLARNSVEVLVSANTGSLSRFR
jgi:hypothetical protein